MCVVEVAEMLGKQKKNLPQTQPSSPQRAAWHGVDRSIKKKRKPDVGVYEHVRR